MSQESLEWDNSTEVEVPSFLTATSTSEVSVEDIIEEILRPDSPAEANLLDPVDIA